MPWALWAVASLPGSQQTTKTAAMQSLSDNQTGSQQENGVPRAWDAG
jgi:hypothetical protein